MAELIFTIAFPLILLGLLVIIFISGIINKYPKQEFISLDEFIKDWLKDHGQADKVNDQFEKMKKDPAGKIYMPITYKSAKFFIKLGLSPNKVSYINLILSFIVFYSVIMAGKGHNLDNLSQQPMYGSWFFLIAFLLLFTGITDGIDGAVARLLNIKSKSGAWLDNIIDRISDTVILACFIHTDFLIVNNLDIRWIVGINILLIFLYEYMRARHEGLGLLETKPFMGERVTRILLLSTFYGIYGVSSFAVLLTYLINPNTTIWSASHEGVTTWVMLIFQLSLLFIMIISSIQLAGYIWKHLKEMDKLNGV